MPKSEQTDRTDHARAKARRERQADKVRGMNRAGVVPLDGPGKGAKVVTGVTRQAIRDLIMAHYRVAEAKYTRLQEGLADKPEMSQLVELAEYCGQMDMATRIIKDIDEVSDGQRNVG